MFPRDAFLQIRQHQFPQPLLRSVYLATPESGRCARWGTMQQETAGLVEGFAGGLMIPEPSVTLGLWAWPTDRMPVFLTVIDWKAGKKGAIVREEYQCYFSHILSLFRMFRWFHCLLLFQCSSESSSRPLHLTISFIPFICGFKQWSIPFTPSHILLRKLFVFLTSLPLSLHWHIKPTFSHCLFL